MCNAYGQIDNVEGTGAKGWTPFKLWPAQTEFFWTLMTERLVITLKPRQIGISWCVCFYVMWCCLFRAGQNWLLFSRGQDEANELIRRIKVMYERLPPWMRDALPALQYPTSLKEIAWGNGSRIKSKPSTKTSGVSYTASGVVIDEAAKIQWGEDLYVSVKPTIDAGNQLIVVSTADGVDGLFYGLWEAARKGLNGFKAVFFPWWVRPGRTAKWYRRICAEAVDLKRVRQEYPANPIEAFLASGRLRFETEWVDAQNPNLLEPLPMRLWPRSAFELPDWEFIPRGRVPSAAELPGLVVFKPPEPGHRYVIAADVAEGKDPKESDDPDFDAAAVVDSDTWEEVATIYGRFMTDDYGRYLMSLGAWYNTAEIVVERNNHGHAVLATMRLFWYPAIALGHDRGQGWETNMLTKTVGIDLLAECLRDRLFKVRYQPTLHELRHYTVLKNGSTGAPHRHHDDLVMVWYLFLSYLRDRTNRPSYVPPRAIGDRYETKNYLNR